MKKHLFFIVALVATTFAAHAQFNKGNQAIGLGFSSRTNEGTATGDMVSPNSTEIKNLGVTLDYSYFINDKIALGAQVSYNNNRSEAIYNDKSSFSEMKGYGFGVYMKKYFMFGEKFGAFAGGDLSSAFSNTDSYSDLSNPNLVGKIKFWSLGLGAQGGIAFFPFKRLSCEAGIAAFNIGYYNEKLENGEGETYFKNNSSSFNASFAKSLDNIMFTLRYHFGFKK